MKWLSTYAIEILVGLVLVLALGWTIDHLIASTRYAHLETKFNTASTDAKNAADANKANQQTITTLRAANEALVKQQAEQKQAASDAADRATALANDLQKQRADNAALRQKLSRENPDVAAYLRVGVPCELARSVWNQAGACQNPDR